MAEQIVPQFPEVFSEEDQQLLTKLQSQQKQMQELYHTHYSPSAWAQKPAPVKGAHHIAQTLAGIIPSVEQRLPPFTPGVALERRTDLEKSIHELDQLRFAQERAPQILNELYTLGMMGKPVLTDTRLKEMYPEFAGFPEDWTSYIVQYMAAVSKATPEQLRDGTFWNASAPQSMADYMAYFNGGAKEISPTQIMSSVAFSQDTEGIRNALQAAYPPAAGTEISTGEYVQRSLDEYAEVLKGYGIILDRNDPSKSFEELASVLLNTEGVPAHLYNEETNEYIMVRKIPPMPELDLPYPAIWYTNPETGENEFLGFYNEEDNVFAPWSLADGHPYLTEFDLMMADRHWTGDTAAAFNRHVMTGLVSFGNAIVTGLPLSILEQARIWGFYLAVGVEPYVHESPEFKQQMADLRLEYEKLIQRPLQAGERIQLTPQQEGEMREKLGWPDTPGLHWPPDQRISVEATAAAIQEREAQLTPEQKLHRGWLNRMEQYENWWDGWEPKVQADMHALNTRVRRWWSEIVSTNPIFYVKPEHEVSYSDRKEAGESTAEIILDIPWSMNRVASITASSATTLGLTALAWKVTKSPMIASFVGGAYIGASEFDPVLDMLVNELGLDYGEAVLWQTAGIAAMGALEQTGTIFGAMRLGFPGLYTRMTGRVMKDTVLMTMRQKGRDYVQKGLTTLVIENVTESMQTVLANVILEHHGDIRTWKDGLGDTFVDVTIGMIPSVVGMGGRYLRHTNSRLTQAQLTLIQRDTQALVDQGIPLNKAKEMAYVKFFESPEGQVAFKEIVAELTPIAEAERRAPDVIRESHRMEEMVSMQDAVITETKVIIKEQMAVVEAAKKKLQTLMKRAQSANTHIHLQTLYNKNLAVTIAEGKLTQMRADLAEAQQKKAGFERQLEDISVQVQSQGLMTKQVWDRLRDHPEARGQYLDKIGYRGHERGEIISKEWFELSVEVQSALEGDITALAFTGHPNEVSGLEQAPQIEHEVSQYRMNAINDILNDRRAQVDALRADRDRAPLGETAAISEQIQALNDEIGTLMAERNQAMQAWDTSNEAMGESYTVRPLSMQTIQTTANLVEQVHSEAVVQYEIDPSKGIGSTVHPTEGNLAGQSYYSVSPYTQADYLVDGIVPGRTVTAEQVVDFIMNNMHLLQNTDHSVGTWYDAQANETYLDIVVTPTSIHTALDLAEVGEQLAIYDLKTGKEIVVAEKDPKTKKVTPILYKKPWTLRHYSAREGSNVVSIDNYGKGASGTEAQFYEAYKPFFDQGDFLKRSYWVVDQGTAGFEGLEPWMSGKPYHDVVLNFRIYDASIATEAEQNRVGTIYDQIAEQYNQKFGKTFDGVPQNRAEMRYKAVYEAGYQGLYVKDGGVVLFQDVQVRGDTQMSSEWDTVSMADWQPALQKQWQVMRETEAIIQRKHQEVESGERKTITKKQVWAWDWRANTGIVYMKGGGQYIDRITGLMGWFNKVPKFQQADADPWIYFTAPTGKKYRVALYTDASLSGRPDFLARLAGEAVTPAVKEGFASLPREMKVDIRATRDAILDGYTKAIASRDLSGFIDKQLTRLEKRGFNVDDAWAAWDEAHRKIIAPKPEGMTAIQAKAENGRIWGEYANNLLELVKPKVTPTAPAVEATAVADYSVTIEGETYDIANPETQTGTPYETTNVIDYVTGDGDIVGEVVVEGIEMPPEVQAQFLGDARRELGMSSETDINMLRRAPMAEGEMLIRVDSQGEVVTMATILMRENVPTLSVMVADQTKPGGARGFALRDIMRYVKDNKIAWPPTVEMSPAAIRIYQKLHQQAPLVRDMVERQKQIKERLATKRIPLEERRTLELEFRHHAAVLEVINMESSVEAQDALHTLRAEIGLIENELGYRNLPYHFGKKNPHFPGWSAAQLVVTMEVYQDAIDSGIFGDYGATYEQTMSMRSGWGSEAYARWETINFDGETTTTNGDVSQPGLPPMNNSPIIENFQHDPVLRLARLQSFEAETAAVAMAVNAKGNEAIAKFIGEPPKMTAIKDGSQPWKAMGTPFKKGLIIENWNHILANMQAKLGHGLHRYFKRFRQHDGYRQAVCKEFHEFVQSDADMIQAFQSEESMNRIRQIINAKGNFAEMPQNVTVSEEIAAGMTQQWLKGWIPRANILAWELSVRNYGLDVDQILNDWHLDKADRPALERIADYHRKGLFANRDAVLAQQTHWMIEGFTPWITTRPQLGKARQMLGAARGSGRLQHRYGVEMHSDLSFYQQLMLYNSQMSIQWAMRADLASFADAVDAIAPKITPDSQGQMYADLTRMINELQHLPSTSHGGAKFLLQFYATISTALYQTNAKLIGRNFLQAWVNNPYRLDWLVKGMRGIPMEMQELSRLSYQFSTQQLSHIKSELMYHEYKPLWHKVPGYMAITRFAKGLNFYGHSDNLPRARTHHTGMAKAYRAIEAFKQHRNVQKLLRDSGMDLYHKQLQHRFLEMVAVGDGQWNLGGNGLQMVTGYQAASLYAGESLADLVHYPYARWIRPPLEQGIEGRLTFNLLTFTREYWLRNIHHWQNIVDTSLPANTRLANFRATAGMVVMGMITSAFLREIFGKRYRAYSPADIIWTNVFGVIGGAANEGLAMGEALWVLLDFAQPDEEKNRAWSRFVRLVRRNAQLHVPYLTSFISALEGASGIEGLDKFMIDKIRGFLNENYTPEERERMEMSMIDRLQIMVFQADFPEMDVFAQAQRDLRERQTEWLGTRDRVTGGAYTMYDYLRDVERLIVKKGIPRDMVTQEDGFSELTLYAVEFLALLDEYHKMPTYPTSVRRNWRKQNPEFELMLIFWERYQSTQVRPGVVVFTSDYVESDVLAALLGTAHGKSIVSAIEALDLYYKINPATMRSKFADFRTAVFRGS